MDCKGHCDDLLIYHLKDFLKVKPSWTTTNVLIKIRRLSRDITLHKDGLVKKNHNFNKIDYYTLQKDTIKTIEPTFARDNKVCKNSTKRVLVHCLIQEVLGLFIIIGCASSLGSSSPCRLSFFTWKCFPNC